MQKKKIKAINAISMKSLILRKNCRLVAVNVRSEEHSFVIQMENVSEQEIKANFAN